MAVFRTGDRGKQIAESDQQLLTAPAHVRAYPTNLAFNDVSKINVELSLATYAFTRQLFSRC
jgi:hypothetical protein